jgi:hypothetical protein
MEGAYGYVKREMKPLCSNMILNKKTKQKKGGFHNEKEKGQHSQQSPLNNRGITIKDLTF